jgi:hypothetical protein
MFASLLLIIRLYDKTMKNFFYHIKWVHSKTMDNLQTNLLNQKHFAKCIQ